MAPRGVLLIAATETLKPPKWLIRIQNDLVEMVTG